MRSIPLYKGLNLIFQISKFCDDTMRILFCNDSFPGNFEALAGLMASDPSNEVLFLSAFVRKDFSIPGVSRVRLRLNRDKGLQDKEKDVFFLAWERAYRVGRQTAHTLMHLRESGFVPDMILTSSADGPGLFLRHVFPETFIVSYLDRYKQRPESPEDRSRLSASLSLQSYQMGQSNLYFVFSERQKQLFSPLLRQAVRTMPSFVDTDMFSPAASASGALAAALNRHSEIELVSFNIRGRSKLSVEQWFPIATGILVARPHCCVALSLGSEQVKKDWQQRMSALPDGIRNRMFFVRFSSLTEYRDFLCTASVHIFSDINDTPIHEILECMSCKSIVMIPKNAACPSFMHHGENCIPIYGSSDEDKIEEICKIIAGKKDEKMTYIAEQSRNTVMTCYSQNVVIPEHVNTLKREFEEFKRIKNYH